MQYTTNGEYIGCLACTAHVIISYIFVIFMSARDSPFVLMWKFWMYVRLICVASVAAIDLLDDVVKETRSITSEAICNIARIRMLLNSTKI